MVFVLVLFKSSASISDCLIVFLLGCRQEDAGWCILDCISLTQWTRLELKARSVDQELIGVRSGEALWCLIETHVFTEAKQVSVWLFHCISFFHDEKCLWLFDDALELIRGQSRRVVGIVSTLELGLIIHIEDEVVEELNVLHYGLSFGFDFL